jgi:hypothetical protein
LDNVEACRRIQEVRYCAVAVKTADCPCRRRGNMRFDFGSKIGECLLAWIPIYPEIFCVLERML